MISANAIAQEFSIPLDVAREIVSDETRRVLVSRWQLWLLLAASLSASIWLFISVAHRHQSSAFWLLSGGVVLWRLLGQHLATPAIREAAQAKSTRVSGKQP